jgi:hypothetical protein
MHRQKGAALLLTIWVILLLSVLAGSALLVARSEALRGRQSQIRAEAIAATDGALRLAIHELSSPDAVARGVETRPMHLTIGAFEVEVTFQRESGKIDLNHASPLLIAELMRQLGHHGTPELARTIESRRSQPRTSGARVLESVLDLVGLGKLDAQIAECATAFTTIYTAAREPELAYADPIVVAAVNVLRRTTGTQVRDSGVASMDQLPAGQLFEITGSARRHGAEILSRVAIVRLTGNPSEPFLTYAWRLGESAENSVSCVHSTT